MKTMKAPIYLPAKYGCRINWRNPYEVLPLAAAAAGLIIMLAVVLTYGGD